MVDLSKVTHLYCDGGVVWDGKSGASSIGGTWAFCAIDAEDRFVFGRYGFVPATETKKVTNQHTEQIAIVLALEAMLDGWSGTVCSDSLIALRRVFKNGRTNNLPKNIIDRSRVALRRVGKVEMMLLEGHPTKKCLSAGVGKKRGHPVSKWNVWCDRACNHAKKERKRHGDGNIFSEQMETEKSFK